MNVDEGRALAREKTEKETTYRHLVSVEGVMRRLGRHFGEDQERWALTGLFHDLDQDQTADDPERHAYLAAGWLRDAGAPEPVVNGVLAPPLVVLVVLLTSDRTVMGEHVNSPVLRWFGWATAGVMTAASVAMIVTAWT